MTETATLATAEVAIHGIASGGDGVGHLPDGRVVFVPRTAPGDRALIRIERSRSHWAKASLVELVEPAPERVPPPCRLFDHCGGCQLQHLPYEAQRVWKARFVVDALERIGGLESLPEVEVVASPETERYRSRMTFTLRRLRGGRVVAGLHALGNPAHVIDIRDACLLPNAMLLESWTSLRASWGSGASRLPAGGRLRLSLRAVPEGVELLVAGGAAGWHAEGLVGDVAHLAAIWHRPGDEDESVLVDGSSGPGRGDAFEQVNPAAADLLGAHVFALASARTSDGASVIDAYCGTGAVGRALSDAGRHVVGIEVEPSAAEAAGRDGMRVVQGRVEAHLADHLPADLVIVNPPRSGLHADVPRALASDPPASIVYVSCDPATLARDVDRLGRGYRLVDLRCFDLFPHTAHVETVALLEPTEVRT